jgi:hypothetical protein
MPDSRSPLQELIAEIEAEISATGAQVVALQQQIEEDRQALASLRRREALVAARGAPSEAALRREVVPFKAHAGSNGTAAVAAPLAENGRRSDVKEFVLEVIRDQAGIDSASLADQVAPLLDTPAINKRKLVHSTVSYLLRKQLVSRDGKRLIPIDAGSGPQLF